MKLIYILTTVYLVLTLSASIVSSAEEFGEYLSSSGQSSDVRLKRVKRKGKSGRGGGRSKGSKPKSGQRVPPADPYPRQPAYNPNYNPGGGAYPKQPGQSYPGQTGYGQHNNPGQTGHNYPGQTGYNNPGQTNYGHNYGQTGGLGGLGAGGLGGIGGKSKGGLGGLGTGLAGGALGAAVGAYGGYKLGKMVGGLGNMGHYGYYNDRHMFVRCDPPPRIEKDPETNITYIPRTVTYDARCDYYDREPPRRHPYYYTGDSSRTSPTILVTAFLTLLSVVLALGADVWHFQRSVNQRSINWLVVS